MSWIQQAVAMFTSSSNFPQIANLAFYWKLDETSGTSIADSKGSNTGTLTGASVNQTGKIGKAVLFGAADDNRIVFTNWRPVRNFSINFWIKNNSDPGNRILSEFNAQATNGWWIIDWWDSSGFWRFWRYSGWFSYLTTTGTGNNWYNGGGWRMVTITRSTDTSKIYVDWVETNSVTSGGDITYDSTDVFQMGAFYNNWPSGQSCKAYLDEVWCWNTVLTSTEITTLYNGGSWLTYP